MDRQPAERHTAAMGRVDVARQRGRLTRSIIQSQLLVAGALLLTVAFVLLFQPAALGQALFLSGLAVMFVVTGAAILIPWTQAKKNWSVLLPIADMVSIAMLHASAPQLDTTIFLVFPVIWMARNFALVGAVGGVTLATVMLWVVWLTTGEPVTIADFHQLVLLPVVLAFIATTTWSTSLRSMGQRLLLRSQAKLTEDAFDRARAQEQTLSEILDAVEFGVIAFDRDGVVTLVNEFQRRSLGEFGVPRAAVVHPLVYQADGHTPYASTRRPFERALAGEQFAHEILWVGEPDAAKRVAFSVTSRGLVTLDGEPDGGVVVMRDVTAELAAITARDGLIASVSHELRTPLTSILGYLELALDDGDVAVETHRMIDVAHRNSERLLILVTDLLLAASDADEERTLHYQDASVAEIVEHSLDDQRAAANLSGIRLRGDISDRATSRVDPLRLRQVVDNLLSNAIKYNRPGGEVMIAVKRVGADVRITVSDTGMGLTAEEIGHLFDRFYRTESARNSTIAGSGLGLGISRDIVRQHGGDLSVSSTPGEGTTFLLVLPVGVTPERPPDPAELGATPPFSSHRHRA
jgi:two-component system phosphate regulon sensor histidine kinase PhoR